ncbi:MAG: gliding motility-associated-like protein [Sphingobacteriales bacterium]|jgi:gliding motility-associated-like protein
MKIAAISTFFLLSAFLFCGIVNAQTDTLDLAGSTCEDASVICTKNELIISKMSNGTADPAGPFDTPPFAESPSCFNRPRKQSLFIKFLAKKTGTLNFTIVPLDNQSEIDWALYEFEGCGDNKTNPQGEIACNYNDNSKSANGITSTGMNTGGKGGSLDPFSQEITVEDGKTYLLLIDKDLSLPNTDTGVSITWGGTFEIERFLEYTLNSTPAADQTVTFCCSEVEINFDGTFRLTDDTYWVYKNDTFPGNTPPAEIFTIGTYNLSVGMFTLDGCRYESQTQLIIENTFKLILPNAFSPNSDGINDRFKGTAQGVQTMTFSVFNRWGEGIYSSGNPSIEWNGVKTNGRKVVPGVYVWRVQALDVNNITHNLSGLVTVTP